MILRQDIGKLVYWLGESSSPLEIPEIVTLVSIVGDAAFVVTSEDVIIGTTVQQCAHIPSPKN